MLEKQDVTISFTNLRASSSLFYKILDLVDVFEENEHLVKTTAVCSTRVTKAHFSQLLNTDGTFVTAMTA